MKKLKLRFLANLGFVYYLSLIIGTLLLLTLAGFAMFGTDEIRLSGIKTIVYMIAFAVALVGSLVKTLIVKMPKPQGFELTENKAPELWQLIDKIRRKIDFPPMNGIIITHELQASVVEYYSYGVFGKLNRYMFVGLPLIMSLSEEELMAVLAHECSHLSKAHSNNFAKLYRAKLIWSEVYQNVTEKSRRQNFLITSFLFRYIPAINNALFKFNRENEFEADRMAASITSPQALSTALLRLIIWDSYLKNNFYPQINQLNRHEANAPLDVYSRMYHAFSQTVDPDIQTKFIESLLKEVSLPYATHPTYLQRIENLGVAMPVFLENNANLDTLKSENHPLIQAMSAQWKQLVNEKWKENYDQWQQNVKKLNILKKEATKTSINLTRDSDKFDEFIHLTEAIEGHQSALDLVQSIIKSDPDNIDSRFHIGRLLLKNGNEQGVDILKSVMSDEPKYTMLCSNLLMNHALTIGQKEEAFEHYYHARDFVLSFEEVKEERNFIRDTDRFVSHDLPNEAVAKVIRVINDLGISKAYLVVRVLEYAPEIPEYLLAVQLKKDPSSSELRAIRQKILDEIAPCWHIFIMGLTKKTLKIEYNFQQIENSRIL
jgi:Zn-dependent protease with chaperone function